ncbi:ribonucleotide reductase [Staphylococcus phage Twort]|uniref:ORF033 n=1 Tax=Staphylococcus phage Twort (strain DSM 17442 / HER 48) TaxID=2908167 RepID=Q4Z9A8_BPTWO|nr:ribonucleotide reductase [Staphylococcus phage Twort]AAX92329.1 ORF033 [Staphylococcus phage Twort]
MELLKEDKYYYTFNVYDVKQKYGFTLNEINMSEYYDIFVNDDDIRKEKYYTRDIMTDIARTQLESGYPYVFYIDNANDNHPLKKLGKVQMSNLCCEVTQLQEVSDIFPYLQSHNDTIGNDVVCTLGSLNLVNVVEKGLLKESVDSGIRSLSKVTDLMNVPFLPSVQKANDELRAIGLGAMNWHGLLAKNMLSYGSRESLDIANSLFSAIRYYSIKSSMELAKETGKVFKGFKESEYYTGEVFSSYIQKSHEPRTKKAKKVLEKVYIPTEEDWNSLSKDVKEYGMYNGYLNNLAPYILGRV